MKRPWIRLILGLAIALCLVAILVRFNGFNWAALSRVVRWHHIVMAVVLYGIAVLAVGSHWYVILRGLGVEVSVTELAWAFLGSCPVSMLGIGAVGADVFRGGWIMRLQPQMKAVVVTSILIDRLSGIAGLVLVGCASFLLCALGGTRWLEQLVEPRNVQGALLLCLAMPLGIAAASAGVMLAGRRIRRRDNAPLSDSATSRPAASGKRSALQTARQAMEAFFLLARKPGYLVASLTLSAVGHFALGFQVSWLAKVLGIGGLPFPILCSSPRSQTGSGRSPFLRPVWAPGI